eukprot:GHVR01142038.1.p1 GENE.GHVR01142038.1~~GHVR01142038.1.p1  ORF type:complete len:234 (+),score=24.13 GHVR01142038.1:56-757(+)
MSIIKQWPILGYLGHYTSFTPMHKLTTTTITNTINNWSITRLLSPYLTRSNTFIKTNLRYGTVASVVKPFCNDIKPFYNNIKDNCCNSVDNIRQSCMKRLIHTSTTKKSSEVSLVPQIREQQLGAYVGPIDPPSLIFALRISPIIQFIKYGVKYIISYKDIFIYGFRAVFQVFRPLIAVFIGGTLLKTALACSLSFSFMLFFSLVTAFEFFYMALQYYISYTFIMFFLGGAFP